MSALRFCLLLFVVVHSGMANSCTATEGPAVTKKKYYNPWLYKTWLQPEDISCTGHCSSVTTLTNPSSVSSFEDSCTFCSPQVVLATEVDADYYVQYGNNHYHVFNGTATGLYFTSRECSCGSDRRTNSTQIVRHCQWLNGTIFEPQCNRQGSEIQFCWSETRPVIKPSRLEQYRSNVSAWIRGGAPGSMMPISPDDLTEEEYTPRSWDFPDTIYRQPSLPPQL